MSLKLPPSPAFCHYKHSGLKYALPFPALPWLTQCVLWYLHLKSLCLASKTQLDSSRSSPEYPLLCHITHNLGFLLVFHKGLMLQFTSFTSCTCLPWSEVLCTHLPSAVLRMPGRKSTRSMCCGSKHRKSTWACSYFVFAHGIWQVILFLISIKH